MTETANRLLAKYYTGVPHPYRLFEQRVQAMIDQGGVDTLLDAGCGRSVPVLRKFLGKTRRLIGVDLVAFTDVPAGIEVHNTDLGKLPLADDCVDLIISRSVFEHLSDPQAVYREFSRVLRPGGQVVFLTANMWDYGTLIARLVPNRLHAKVVRLTEGREEEDTFPTEYRTNTRGDVDRLCAQAGLEVQAFAYVSQYPNYLMFNGALFFLGMCFEKLISRVEALRLLRGWILVTLRKPMAAAT
jgi:SAM-dependent methyltransferase